MRIRSVRPEFWRDETIKRLPREYRFLLIGLWSYVDDNGVGLDDYRQIAAALFPIEDDPVEAREWVHEGLMRLAESSHVLRYTMQGIAYLYVARWPELQYIQHPNKSRFPEPDDPESQLCRENDESPAAAHERVTSPHESLPTGVVEKGRNGEREKPSPSSGKRRSKSSDTPARFDEFWSIYPKRVGKQAAIKAWRNALKLAAPDTIINGAQRYAESRHGEDPKFTAHPSRWLNAGRWDDEQQPAHSPQPEMSTADRRIAQLQAMKQQNRPRDPPGDTTLRSVSGGRLA